MPTDTPSPLAATVEALLRLFDESGHFRGSTELFRAETGAPECPWQHPGNSAWMRKYEAWERKHALALRAALAADAAWRARAEAAVAWVESYRNCRVAMKKAEAERTLDADIECRAAFDVYDDARRRYEDAARG